MSELNDWAQEETTIEHENDGPSFVCVFPQISTSDSLPVAVSSVSSSTRHQESEREGGMVDCKCYGKGRTTSN